jgi:hypothetical protein
MPPPYAENASDKLSVASYSKDYLIAFVATMIMAWRKHLPDPLARTRAPGQRSAAPTHAGRCLKLCRPNATQGV